MRSRVHVSSRGVRVAAGTILASSLVTGVLLATNMAHFATIHLYAATPGVSNSGTNTINLPYDLGPNIHMASDLMNDIGFADVANVSRFIPATDGLASYTGRRGSGPDFALTPGECYFIKMNVTTDYEISGAHLPSVSLSLLSAGPGSLDGTNFISLPFNTTSKTAQDLMNDIGFSNVAYVSRYLRETDSLQTYTGRRGSGPDFPISFDECYFVKMLTTTNYVPSHY